MYGRSRSQICEDSMPRPALFCTLILLATIASCSPGFDGVLISPAPNPPPPTDPPPAPSPPPPSLPPPTPSPGDPFAGGVIATFRIQGTGPGGTPVDETFRVWVTNSQTISDLFDIQAGVSPTRFPNGRFRSGPGWGDHNLPWSWHLDPEDTQMAEVSMEVCDGRPSVVEQSISDYLKVGRYCPWSARLTSIEDHR
jgi:hypothetical protein